MDIRKNIKIYLVDQVILLYWSSSSFTLRKLECLRQPLGALNTLAWDNKIGFKTICLNDLNND